MLAGFAQALPSPSPAQQCAFITRPDAIAILNLDVLRPSRRIALDFEPLDVALGADGRTLFVARSGGSVTASARVPIAAAIDLATGSTTQITDGCEVTRVSSLCGTSAIAITPDGITALAVGYDSSCTCVIGEIAAPGRGCDLGEHRIIAIDTRTREVQRYGTLSFGSISGFLGNVPCRPARSRTEIAIAPDGQSAVITDGRDERGQRIFGAVKVRGVRTPSERVVLAGSCAECEPRLFYPGPVAISADGATAFVGNTRDTPTRSIVPVDIATSALGDPVAVLGFAPFALAAPGARVLLAASGPRLSATDPDPSLAVIDPSATAPPSIVPLPDDAFDIAVAANGRAAYIAIAGDAGVSMVVLELPSATVRSTILIDDTPVPGVIAVGTAPGACPPPPGPCVGDCDDNGEITLGEVQSGFQIFLGIVSSAFCPAFDRDESQDVSLGEVQLSFNGFLHGCLPDGE